MKRVVISVVIIFIAGFLVFPEEGMYPLSEIHKLDLFSKGFRIDSKALYNPEGISLIDGIVNLSGCTGSFVSADGLILTNHHCAFRAIQSISTKEKDFLKHGFSALSRGEERQAKGYTVRITESYRDVSREVLSVVKGKMGFVKRTKAIEKKIKEIIVRTEKRNPGKRAEVAEMFMGKTYVLFIYTYLKDIRLVYAPPRSIGNFGGETDNWMWPRHTGDFSFMRAYVAPDGTPAAFSEKNVPYSPKKFLKVAPEGVEEGDLIFILGYPGRTYRHCTSHFLSYEQEIRMPYAVRLYEWQISVLEKMGEKDRSVELKISPRIKGLSNRMKNYRGKLIGLKRLKLAKKRRGFEKTIQDYIDSENRRKKRYGDVLERIGKVFEQKVDSSEYELLLDYLKRSCDMLRFAYTAYEASIELKKKDTDRERSYMKRNYPRTIRRLKRSLKNFHEPADKVFLKEMIIRALNLEGKNRILPVEEIVEEKEREKAIKNFIQNAYSTTCLRDEKHLMSLFKKSTKELNKSSDPFMILAKKFYPLYQKLKEARREQKGILDELSAKLIEVTKKLLGKEFIPDANGTLRLTFGRIKGYSPADAVHLKPITTLTGVIQKDTGKTPFNVPKKLKDLYNKKDFGRFKHPGLNDVPVGILYSADTTGGNSGSPVLNAKGELIGLNFDRAFEATINDYAWSMDYSRSIGVDIRYILWFIEKFAGAAHLLKEMNIH